MQTRAYRWLQSLVKEVHQTQVRTLLELVGAVCRAGRLRSLEIADVLARLTTVHRKNALQRFYRWVNGSKIDVVAVWRELTTRLLLGISKPAVISVDWTDWRFDLKCLVASLAVGRRAVPVFVQSFSRAPPRMEAIVGLRRIPIAPRAVHPGSSRLGTRGNVWRSPPRGLALPMIASTRPRTIASRLDPLSVVK